MNELRGSLRALVASPLVALMATMSLALGIGANTTIFSIVDSLLLRSLPVEQPSRLVVLFSNQPGMGSGSPGWTNPLWEQIRSRSGDVFQSAFAYRWTRFDLSQSGETDLVEGLWASGEYFDVLGVPAILGRTFTTIDDQRGGGPDGPVAVISYAFWHRRFGGAADVIGQTLAIERIPFTIIGVTPKGFFGVDVGRAFDVAVPIETEPLVRGQSSVIDSDGTWWLRVMARLKADQDLNMAQAAFRGIQPQIRAATFPPNVDADTRERYLAAPVSLERGTQGTSSLRSQYSHPMLALTGVVGLVLLIACTNIANLLLVRAASMRHELGVRLALGASRWDLMRQILAESLLLSAAGSVVGILIAIWTTPLLVQQLSTQTRAVFLAVGLDWRALLFTASVAAIVTVLCGIIPALRAAGTGPMEAIRGRNGAPSGAVGRFRVSHVILAGQVAISLVLVVIAGLFVRTFSSLSQLDLGFDRDAVLLARLQLKQPPNDASQRAALFARIAESVRSAPGVAEAAISDVTPVSGLLVDAAVEIENGPLLDLPENISYKNAVSPDWFRTYGTPVLQGRDFDERDRSQSPRVTIVNEAFVRRFFLGGNPIGRRLRQGDREPWLEVVGVAGDAIYLSLRDAVPPTMYVPIAQEARVPSQLSLSVRADDGDPSLLARGVAEAIATVEHNTSITFTRLEEQVDGQLTQERLIATLAAFLGALALLLSGLGLYGVTSYLVGRSRREIGIRVAFGASRDHVLRIILCRVGAFVGGGLLVGATASLWTSRYVESLLFRVRPHDAPTLLFASTLLVAVALVAVWLPARRAASLNPARVLRDE